MTNVTKPKARDLAFDALYRELASVLGSLDEKSSMYFIDELLTGAERVMLIKRFAAVVMFKRGYTQYKVWNTLEISPATASRIYRKFKAGGYKNLTHKSSKQKCSPVEMPSVLVFIEKLIRAQGRDRWILLG